MAMVEELERSGNWLFRWRSYLPIVLYLLALPVMIFGLDDHMNHHAVAWTWVCIAVSMFGLFIRAFTIGYTPRGTSGRNTKEGQVAESLNTRGIYSMVRHPLYLGNYFMWIGIIMYVGNWWFTGLCTLLFWLYYERIMFAEESFLCRKFGNRYIDWSNDTPPFLPRFRNYTSPEVTFSLKNVLKREYNGFFAVFVSFFFIHIVKNYVQYQSLEFELLVDKMWLILLPSAFLVFIVLRTLKKSTKVLDVSGREYVKES